jgi:ADP-ribose pyrophosphatase YjhB (NUDIX family)
MNFCSNCGSQRLSFIVPRGDNRNRFVCANCDTIHYSNPKIIAGCLPVWGKRVLLCKRAIEPRKGFWNVPAGFMENGETVEEGAAREVWEEALGKVDNLRMLALFSIPRIDQVYVHFCGDLVDGKFGVGPESLESQLFLEKEIPWEDIAFSSSTFALKHFFEDRKNGSQHVHLGSLR